MQQPFQALITLVNFDQQLRTMHDNIARLDEQHNHVLSQRTQLEQQYERMKELCMSLQKQVDEQESTTKEFDTQVKIKKNQLDNLVHYKEFQSIKTDLDSLYVRQRHHEQQLIAAWDQLESQQKLLQLFTIEYNNAVEQYATLLHQIEHATREHHDTLALLLRERTLLEQQVPNAWLEKYIIMQTRVVDPVVSVEHNSCSVCFYPLTQQDKASIQRLQLVQCKGCYRLLFSASLFSSDTQLSSSSV